MAKKTVISKGVSLGSLFKIFFLGLLLSIGPIIILLGVLSFFGFHTFFWHGQPLTGFDGLLASIIMAPVFAAVMSLIIGALVAFGLWVYTRVFTLRITFKLRGNFSDY